jgi:hypothetical protein
MTLTIDLQPDLERLLRAEAARLGLEPQAYVLRAVRERLGAPANGDETDLIQRINAGLPAATWRRYHELAAKRQAETLSPAEQQELIGLSDRIEQANAQRMRSLSDLARLRGTTLEQLLSEFGIPPVAAADHG